MSSRRKNPATKPSRERTQLVQVDQSAIADFVAQIAASKPECNTPNIRDQVVEFLNLVYTTDISGEDLTALVTKVALETSGPTRNRNLLPFDRSTTRTANMRFSSQNVNDAKCNECKTLLWRIAFDGCRLLPRINEELRVVRGTVVPQYTGTAKQINTLVGDRLGQLKKRYTKNQLLADFITYHPEIRRKSLAWKNAFYNNLLRLMALVDYMHLPGVDQRAIVRALNLEGVLSREDDGHDEGTRRRRSGARVGGKRRQGKEGTPVKYRVLWEIVDRYWQDLPAINRYLYSALLPFTGATGVALQAATASAPTVLTPVPGVVPSGTTALGGPISVAVTGDMPVPLV